MAIYTLLEKDNTALTIPLSGCSKDLDRVELKENLIATMNNFHGIGLSASQCGVMERAFVMYSDIKKKVLLKEAHLDTLTSNPIHLDFYEINESEKVKVSCPLKFTGKPEGVKNGGVIQTLANEVQVQCLPENIPNNIEIDIKTSRIVNPFF